jgi:hypothetical protein
MIKHIVFFRITSPEKGNEKQNLLIRMKQIFDPLAIKLPYIVDFKIGINYNPADFAWDFVIDSVFKNREDLERYQVSKEHQSAVLEASGIQKIKAVVDYEF